MNDVSLRQIHWRHGLLAMKWKRRTKNKKAVYHKTQLTQSLRTYSPACMTPYYYRILVTKSICSLSVHAKTGQWTERIQTDVRLALAVVYWRSIGRRCDVMDAFCHIYSSPVYVTCDAVCRCRVPQWPSAVADSTPPPPLTPLTIAIMALR